MIIWTQIIRKHRSYFTKNVYYSNQPNNIGSRSQLSFSFLKLYLKLVEIILLPVFFIYNMSSSTGILKFCAQVYISKLTQGHNSYLICCKARPPIFKYLTNPKWKNYNKFGKNEQEFSQKDNFWLISSVPKKIPL